MTCLITRHESISSLKIVCAGLGLTGVGVAMAFAGDVRILFAAIFGLIGLLILGAGVFYLGKSLLVRLTDKEIRSRRFLFGYPITTWRMATADIDRIELKKAGTYTSGNTTTTLPSARRRYRVVSPERVVGTISLPRLRRTSSITWRSDGCFGG